MKQFLVETYVAAGNVDLPATGARARAAAERLSSSGQVRYLRSILLPEDETCFHLFEAESREAVELVSEAAGIRRLRIVEAIQ